MQRYFVPLGAVNAFLAIALGAFGAHALKTRLSAEMLAIYQTGAQYQMAHALALILIGLLSERTPSSTLITLSGNLLLLGIVLFSGSLYALSLSGIRLFGAITPLGGLSFLIGWALLAIATWRRLP